MLDQQTLARIEMLEKQVRHLYDCFPFSAAETLAAGVLALQIAVIVSWLLGWPSS